MIQALSAERPDYSFGDGVRARACHRRGDGINADSFGPLAEVAPVDRVVITQQMAWLVAPGRRLDHLPPHPGSRRIGRHVDVDQFPPTVGDEHEHVQRLERECLQTVSRSAAHRWWAWLARNVRQVWLDGLAGPRRL